MFVQDKSSAADFNIWTLPPAEGDSDREESYQISESS